MNNKLQKLADTAESHSIEIERISDLTSILLQEHFESKLSYLNKDNVTFYVPYDDNFRTLTEVIYQMLTIQLQKSKEILEQLWELTKEIDDTPPQKK